MLDKRSTINGLTELLCDIHFRPDEPKEARIMRDARIKAVASAIGWLTAAAEAEEAKAQGAER